MLTSNPYDAERRRAARRHGRLPAAGRRPARARRRRRSRARRRDRRHRGARARTSSPATGACPRRRRKSSPPTAGSRPATSARSTAAATSTIVGRSKDLIISGGYNVYPAEIEGYINEMPGVAESAVVGVPHPDFGEVGVAVVDRPSPGATLDGDAIVADAEGASSPTSRCPSAASSSTSCRATPWARCRRTCCASSTRACSPRTWLPAAVGPREDLEAVAVGVVPVDAAAAVPVVDLAGLSMARVGPVGQAACADAAEDVVELGLAHQEGQVLPWDVALDLHVVEGDAVVHFHALEGPEGDRCAATEDLRQEHGRCPRIAGPDDRVVQLDGHAEDARPYCTSSTEVSVSETTLVATEPMSARPKMPWPWVPITISSAPLAAATFRISSAAWPWRCSER